MLFDCVFIHIVTFAGCLVCVAVGCRLSVNWLSANRLSAGFRNELANR